jgi:hypothetical protein
MSDKLEWGPESASIDVNLNISLDQDSVEALADALEQGNG